MRTIVTLSILLCTATASQALISKASHNGVVSIGTSLSTLLDEQDQSSLRFKCQKESRGTRFFSNSCTKLVESLQKKMSMMALESDLQMQAERMNVIPSISGRTDRIAMLAKINLLSLQAEETIKGLAKGSDTKEHLPEILPAIEKVQTSYQAYLKLIPNGKN